MISCFLRTIKININFTANKLIVVQYKFNLFLINIKIKFVKNKKFKDSFK